MRRKLGNGINKQKLSTECLFPPNFFFVFLALGERGEKGSRDAKKSRKKDTKGGKEENDGINNSKLLAYLKLEMVYKPREISY